MALKDDGVNIINGINYGAFTEALNNKMDRNLANPDNDGQAILDQKMDIDFTNISAIGQAVLDKKVEIEALLEGNGYAKFSWKDGNKISSLIIQWGVASSNDPSSVTGVNLPTTFPLNYCGTITLLGNAETGYIGNPVSLSSKSNLSTLYWSKAQYTASTSIMFVLIGY